MAEVHRYLITGTHGCGKSTLSHRICSELKKSGYNAIVLSETARESPFPINQGQTVNATLYIALRQAVKELEAIAHGYQYLVLDRGVLDSFVYSEATRRGEISEVEAGLLEAFKVWTREYDDIIFVKSEGNDTLQADGVRDTDMEFAQKVERLFERLLVENFGDRMSILTYGDMLKSKIRIGDGGKICLDYEWHYGLVS
ncbi:MAG: ATP-binding protein [Puniceicoccales bacterium]|jgi:thymidylate kinase|nr:ATP-binding protein [Puniceicoccales bacterium]